MDLVVGIPSYNNARTIGHVVRAVDVGLAKYFPHREAVIVNSDGGSKDGTPEVVRSVAHDHAAFFLSHPIYPVHRISIPYTGTPGKGSAIRAIFEKAVEWNASACCVVDADLRSITPEWIELLLAPVLKRGFDFVAPFYSRHKYDGTITNSIVYPMTRALYGRRIRQPIGGDFGFSGKLADFYLRQEVWESQVARFGIDIWLTTEAVANGFRVCQTFLGAKIHDPKDPASDLSEMLVQVVVTLFNLAEKHFDRWKEIRGSTEVPTFGFQYHVGLEPIQIDLKKMLDIFRAGVRDLKPLWIEVLGPGDFGEVDSLAASDGSDFRFSPGLWTRVIHDYALAYRKKKISPEHLLKSLTPLYLGKTASFVMKTAEGDHEAAEAEIEKTCLSFEAQKEDLVHRFESEGGR